MKNSGKQIFNLFGFIIKALWRSHSYIIHSSLLIIHFFII